MGINYMMLRGAPAAIVCCLLYHSTTALYTALKYIVIRGILPRENCNLYTTHQNVGT